MAVLHYYLKSPSNTFAVERKLQNLRRFDAVKKIDFEYCFNIQIDEEFFADDVRKIKWILSDLVSEENNFKESPFLKSTSNNQFLIEIGPRLNFSTPFSTNAVSVCHSAGLTQVARIEKSIRYLISVENNAGNGLKQEITNALHDRMTEYLYENPITSFDHGVKPQPWYIVDVMSKGKKALEEINEDLGLAFDDWDLNFYTELFNEKLKRNPTSVECFDLAQSNSEHSRHWFFKGLLNIDGNAIPESLFKIIMDTQQFSNQNNVIKFNDNSSVIQGFQVKKLKPKSTDKPSQFETENSTQHLAFTAETHNFPTAVSPFSGAATGTGGRIRDVQAVGRGANVIAGTVGYAVGNLLIPGYNLPWEEKTLQYSSTFAKPLDIIIEASNGCSDYGNKFGEPVICGFTRSYSFVNEGNHQRIEYIKPILFSGGMGTLDDRFIIKEKPSKGMKVVKIGGPVYRIGVGGGSASSTKVQGDNKAELDYGAVQRGDPEMEQKMNRVVRSCIENSNNPILSIHDQGAGGNGNVLKELVEPEGAVICCKAFELGDPSINVLELWGAEYQENNGILCSDDSIAELKSIAHRERCPINVVGTVTNSGRIILAEEFTDYENILNGEPVDGKRFPVDLELELVLGKVPRKEFELTREPALFKPLNLPANLQIWEALNLVLRHLTVCSKRFLTNKVDRSVTGLVVQQQCVGPLQAPISDVAVTAISYFDPHGIATSIGEQPIKGLLDPAAGARMSVAEALSNLVFAKISSIKDIKCSGNWMWPAKLQGEGANLYDACVAMCSIMKSVGIAVDGGKDSLSMAVRLDNQEIVKSPGTLVISTYAPCPDFSKIITADVKSSQYGINGVLLLIDISAGKKRLGGSVLAQCYKQLGQEVPDIENPSRLVSAFEITQKLIEENKVLSGHDISDGGFITTVIEMALAGMSGVKISIPKSTSDIVTDLFVEECGWILECESQDSTYIIEQFTKNNVTCSKIGTVEGYGMDSEVTIELGGEVILNVDLNTLCAIWEDTSYQIEKLQMNPVCANQEYKSFQNRKIPDYDYSLEINPSRPLPVINIQVALIREEGLNGDREMAAALHMAGFEVWDCTMQDLLDEKITIERFRGIIFPGGFSYADVFGAAKGWAATLLYNKKLYDQFEAFYNRNDTFSFGVCNGCQLMSLIKWIGRDGSKFKDSQIELKENLSGRFESRFSSVKITKSPAIMLKGMENSILGVWVAHGEGRFTFSSDEFEEYLNAKNCIAVRYVDDRNEATEQYPFNPNGSRGGVAGICSADGRHLAMMPHPERCVQFWQWPYIPAKWKKIMSTSSPTDNLYSPWFQIFLNAYAWCTDKVSN
ncbi:phosphoribosylformylglycinamidine synthase [Planococcus citri]|uniref:phosphoribosylformylglycinamidine synthase n=1 Tax=Planococcus citri TaxID=170843 RepID=UPI0031F93FB9